MPERELISGVDECLANGRLNPNARRGWSRFPLHRCNLRGSWPRKKRWDYWCVTTDSHLFSVTYASVDYLGLVSAWFHDFASGTDVRRSVVIPFAIGFAQPETVGGADMVFDGLGLRVAIIEEPEGTKLGAEFSGRGGVPVRAEILVGRPPRHESLNVLIPWSTDRFQFTSKQNTRPARGIVHVGADTYGFDQSNNAYGTLDFGRGVWPYETKWNWGSASGRQGDRVVGLQLGGKWTDGTGHTENGIVVNGRLSKISEDLVWDYDTNDFMAPWRIRTPESSRIDLEFVPIYDRSEKIDLKYLGTEVHQCFGHYTGTVVDSAGTVTAVDRLFGWAEEFDGKW